MTFTDGTGGVLQGTSPAQAQSYATTPSNGVFDPYAPVQGRYMAPGGAVDPGLRIPFGPAREWAEPRGQRDFLFEATGFRREWGTPNPVRGFRWNPERWVYEQDVRRDAPAAAKLHFTRLEARGFYIQPYRETTQAGLSDWKLRQVKVPPGPPSVASPYKIISTDTGDFFFKPPEYKRPEPPAKPEPASSAILDQPRLWPGGPPVQALPLDPSLEGKFGGTGSAWTPQAEPGTYTTPDGRTVTVYAPGHWDEEPTTWEDYVRDPTQGGKRTMGLGVDWYQSTPPRGGWKRDPVTGLLPEGYSAEAARAQRVRTLQERNSWGPQSVEAIAKKQFEQKLKNEAVAREVARLEEEERKRIEQDKHRALFGWQSKGEALPDFMKDQVPVPSVRGEFEGAGTEMLRQAGFREEVRRIYSHVKWKKIVDQTPRGGTALPGSTVVIYVSKGPKT